MSRKSLSNSRVIKVECQSLRVHPTAQRDILPSKIKKLMQNLDLDAIGVLHAVEYTIKTDEGPWPGPWIIDGQHRWHAIMKHGFGEWLVEVKIHIDVKDHATASKLFLELNDRAPVSPYQKFKNELSAGFTEAVGVVELLRRYGLRVSPVVGDGLVCCVTALKNLYKQNSGETLELTIDTILRSWGRTATAVEGKIIEGIGLLYSTYNGSIDRAALTKKLAKCAGGPAGILGRAKGLAGLDKTPLPRCVAEVIIAQYNSGRKSGRLDPL